MLSVVIIRLPRSYHHQQHPRSYHHQPYPVGGTFWARVPISSAEVRRVFVHHIVEVEDDEEGDEVNGEVEEIKNSTHNEMTRVRAM